MDQRREGRPSNEIPGDVCLPNGKAAQIYASQLSPNGCHLSGDGLQLRTGDRISFYLGAIGPLEAQVSWADDHLVRVELAKPLQPAVLVHFAASVLVGELGHTSSPQGGLTQAMS